VECETDTFGSLDARQPFAILVAVHRHLENIGLPKLAQAFTAFSRKFSGSSSLIFSPSENPAATDWTAARPEMARPAPRQGSDAHACR